MLGEIFGETILSSVFRNLHFRKLMPNAKHETPDVKKFGFFYECIKIRPRVF
jgi:hypothetical protein